MQHAKTTLIVKILASVINLFYSFLALLLLSTTAMMFNSDYPDNPNVNKNFLYVFSFLTPFGIYAVWWMIKYYDTKTIQQIPRFIWLSVGLGIIAFISFWLSDTNKESMDIVKLLFAITFVGGPLWIGSILLIVMIRRNNKTQV